MKKRFRFGDDSRVLRSEELKNEERGRFDPCGGLRCLFRRM